MPAIYDLSNFLPKNFGGPAGTRIGNKVWTGTSWEDPANPNDPQQQMNWAISKQNDIAGQGLFGNEQSMKELMKLLGPLFAQQTSNLDRAQGNALTGASRASGAYAASKGYDNPFSFQQRARGSVYDSFAPQYGQLQENQLGTTLSSAAQNQQFKYGNAKDMTGLWSQLFQMNEQAKNQPSFWENLLGGLIGAGGQLGAAAIMAPAAPAAIAASDIRLKENIVKIGKTPKGHNLYTWDWKKPLTGSGIGVIAQEVPEASVDMGGILFVDYSKVF